jgi:DNA helicase IV
VAHPDIPAEQAHLDRAYECLERMRLALLRTVGAAGVGEDGFDIAAGRIQAWVNRRLAAYERAEEILCFGRIDLDSVPEPLHVGRRWVHDDDEVLVVNWQAPAARPFYTATPAEPHGVTLRRRFRLQDRTLTGISDERLDGSLADAASSLDDFLLEELERTRDTRMRDIVATIQADQYGLIARAPEPPLVIQGGPGTGKTAVGLHRASYLLFAHREELRRILLVGPNARFMDYISHVLPSLGEESVDQLAVAELVEGVEATLEDPYDVQRLKAEERMAGVVRRAVELLSQGRPEELVARLEGHFVGVEADEVELILREARDELGFSAAARERFRMNVLRRFYSDYGETLGGLAVRSFEEIERGLRRDGLLTGFLDRVWPAPRAEQLIRRLFTSRELLADAAEGILDGDEQSLLRRSRSGWSVADLPLVDEARALLRGVETRYGHVVVDEAQDLTPMEVRMIARRTSGAFTLLGDVAQATGPIPYTRWSDLLATLPGGGAAEIEELEHGYRVPREIMALALPLLAHIAPGTQPPVAYRAGVEQPRFVTGDPPLDAAFAEAAELADGDGLLAVIAPASLRGDSEGGSLFDDTRIPVLTPREAKGMEFDHVVVVEPALIVEEAAGGQGLRELYVALTRPTTTLVVVHSRPLPEELGLT